MAEGRRVIVNADDFGQSHGVNRGVALGHEQGIVTSTSLMVRWPAARAAAAYGAQHPALSIGLHLDLGEWVFRDDTWVPLYEVVPLSDAHGVEREVRHQFEQFEELIGRPPTHVDSHQHMHTREPVRRIVEETASRLGIPVRHLTDRVQYCGRFYGQDERGAPLPHLISYEALVEVLTTLPPGTHELGCHPAAERDLETMYSAERELELATLCDGRRRAAADASGVTFCSFMELDNPK